MQYNNSTASFRYLTLRHAYDIVSNISLTLWERPTHLFGLVFYTKRRKDGFPEGHFHSGHNHVDLELVKVIVAVQSCTSGNTNMSIRKILKNRSFRISKPSLLPLFKAVIPHHSWITLPRSLFHYNLPVRLATNLSMALLSPNFFPSTSRTGAIPKGASVKSNIINACVITRN